MTSERLARLAPPGELMEPLPVAIRRGILALVIFFHVGGGWALTQVEPVKLIVGDVAPMEVRMVSDPAAPDSQPDEPTPVELPPPELAAAIEPPPPEPPPPESPKPLPKPVQRPAQAPARAPVQAPQFRPYSEGGLAQAVWVLVPIKFVLQ